MTSLGVPEAVRETQLAPGTASRVAMEVDRPRLGTDTASASGGPASAGRSRLGLTQLRWITIGVPVVVLAVLVHLMAFALPAVFQTTVGYVATVALLVLAVVTFSYLVFAAIERLERRVTQQNARLSVLASVAAALSEGGEQGAISQRVLEDICANLAADAAVMRLSDARTDGHGLTTYALDAPANGDRAAIGRLGTIAMPLDGATLVSDTASDSEYRDIAQDLGFRSLLLVSPAAHGSTEGTLVVASRQARHFSEEDRQLLEQIADQIGLATQRSSLLAELVDRNEELRCLNGHSAALAAAAGSPEVLDVVLRTLVEVSASEVGEFWLDEDGTLQLAHRLPAETQRRRGLTAATDGPAAPADAPSERLVQARRSGTSIFEVSDGTAHGCLPVRAGGQVFGVVYLGRQRAGIWSDRRRRLLEAIVDQGGVAVSEARQRARAREVAVLEERGRIAREMHDGLAQVLGYLNTKTYAIRKTLDSGDTASAAVMMADLEEAARDASADVREGVLALRSTDTSERNLLGNISMYVQKFQRMSGIRVECHVSADCDALRLSEMAELQIIRLIQEALSNVRKHSGSAQAMVSIATRAGSLDVRIDDDGRGFDTASQGTGEVPSFGLQTMRERAEAAGGRLSVTSAPGEGTHINAIVPLQPSSQAAA